MQDIDKLVENYFKPSNEKLSFNTLLEMIEEQMDNIGEILTEEEQLRFSVTLGVPKLAVSEAFGDPESQSRQEINKVFASITGGQNIKARIQSINKFLDPEAAKRKRSPRVIINMMMIVEALQATLNDYNESAAGFVFEGFMAALTGGKQISGRVAGTLPIEDFVAFSEFGADQPVSLKLLRGSGETKGSFTNIVDFLLVRGAPKIKYLVAYKQTSSKGGVEYLNFFAFDITRENFIDFIIGINDASLLSPIGEDILRVAFAKFAANPKEGLSELAQLVVQLGGYQRAGLLHKFAKTGELPSELSPEEEAALEAAGDISSYDDYVRTLKTSDPEKHAELTAAIRRRRKREREESRAAQSINESIERGDVTLNEAFHYLEKKSMLLEAKEAGSQWKASLNQLETLGTGINWESFGELNLSESNISQLVEIYSNILGDELKNLLINTKELTENIGTYYAAKKRKKAQAAGKVAEKKAIEIKNSLEADPRYSEQQ